jgi:hypothetical protein
MHSTEVEIAYSTCDGSKVVIVPDTELPKMEESALEDVRCHECEETSRVTRPIRHVRSTANPRSFQHEPKFQTPHGEGNR